MQHRTRSRVPLFDGSAQEVVAALREEIHRLEAGRPRRWDGAPLSAGCTAIDRLLPEGGLRRGWLTEWLGVPGGGAGTLALIAAREACFEGGALVVMDRERRFYPPAAAALGIDLEATIVVRPRNLKDELWALDQVLRHGGVAAVWAPAEALDEHTFRRLQLAAEEGGVLGLLVRPAAMRGRPSWSETQFWVEPMPASSLSDFARERAGGETPSRKDGKAARAERFKEAKLPRRWKAKQRWGTREGSSRRLRVELMRCRGSPAQGAVEIELDEVTGALRGVIPYKESHSLSLASTLADLTPSRRSTPA